MDALSELLAIMGPRLARLRRVELAEGERVEIAGGDLSFAATVAGRLRTGHEGASDSGPGGFDIHLVPGAHGVATADGTVLFVGGYTLDRSLARPLFENAPPHVRTRFMGCACGEYFRSALAMADMEQRQGGAGADLIVSRVIEGLFLFTLRALATDPRRFPETWLRALSSPQMGRALHLIHTRPGEGWTLERLAREAGMSRSLFAERFTDLFHEPPMTYLRRWRMIRARRLLEASGLPMVEIAERTGYASEAAFSKVFKQHFGVPPSQLRRAG